MTPTALRQWRTAHALTQAQVAALLNLSWATISAWERGEYPIPRKYAAALATLQDPEGLADAMAHAGYVRAWRTAREVAR